MRHAFECMVECAEALADSGRRINIKRRAVLLSKMRERYAINMQMVLDKSERGRPRDDLHESRQYKLNVAQCFGGPFGFFRGHHWNSVLADLYYHNRLVIESAHAGGVLCHRVEDCGYQLLGALMAIL